MIACQVRENFFQKNKKGIDFKSMVYYTYSVTKENARKEVKKMGNRKNPENIDWQAVAISFAVSVLSGILVALIVKLLGL